jgi:hypothetical protein
VTCGFCLETKLLAPDELNKRVRMNKIADFLKYSVALQTADFQLALSFGEHRLRDRPREIE